MIRPISASDIDAITACRASDHVSVVAADRFKDDLARHQYRLAWTWIAEQEGELRARALWWGPPDAEHPVSLDCVWVDPQVADPAELAAALLSAAHEAVLGAGADPPDYQIEYPTIRRDEPSTAAGIEWRLRAAARVGLTEVLERVAFERTAASPPVIRSGRLELRPADDDAFLAAFARVAQGSLDTLTRRNLEQMGPEAQAQDDLDFYTDLPGDRSAWRLAHDRDGQLVGLAIPSRTAYDASVSYLGVVPEARGRGYVDDLLAEITLAHEGAPRITGMTDATNQPMIDAFLRADYVTTTTRLVVSAR